MFDFSYRRRKQGRYSCPRCGKIFKTQISVTKHLRQPYSSCLTNYKLKLKWKSNHDFILPDNLDDSDSSPEVTHEKIGLNDMDDTSMELDVNESFQPLLLSDSSPGVIDDTPMELESFQQLPLPVSAVPESTPSPFSKEMYRGASKIFGKGKTFMDEFDGDKFSEQRENCPYYPFASRDEWEVSSFLLGSNLSMASIDKFLKLKLASS
jgi:uncharacterized C2H2 Zn-finger protein